LIFMIGIHESNRGVPIGFRLIDTDTMSIKDVKYDNMVVALMNNRIKIENIKFDYTTNEIEEVDIGVNIEDYPKIKCGHCNSNKKLIIIGKNASGDYVCVDADGVRYDMNVYKLKDMSRFGMSVSNKYILEVEHSKSLGIIDGKCDTLGSIDSKEFRKYKIKSSLLGVKDAIIKEINDSVVLVAVNKNAENIVVPSFVEEIGDYAFGGCKKLKSVVIHKGVKRIGKYAFTHCKSLKTVDIPVSVEHIGDGAFQYSGLKSAVIRGNIKELPNIIFLVCESLESVEMTNTVEVIGINSFGGCGCLKSISIIGDTNKGGINLHRGLREIKDLAFSACKSIENVYIPDTVKEIGMQVFMKCNELKNINIPRGIIIINTMSITDSKIKKLDIPKNVDRVAGKAFECCKELEEVNIHNKNIEIAKGAFDGCSKLYSVNFIDGDTVSEVDIDDIRNRNL